MALGGIPLTLLLLTACSGAAAVPPGQPRSGPSPASATPTETTIEQTEAELNREVAGSEAGPRRIVTVYHVNDRSAVDLLMDWLRRQDGVASVRLEDGITRTRTGGAGNRNEGTAYVAEEAWWQVAVEGEVKELGPVDVAGWIRMLRRVPRDVRWRLGPSVVVT